MPQVQLRQPSEAFPLVPPHLRSYDERAKTWQGESRAQTIATIKAEIAEIEQDITRRDMLEAMERSRAGGPLRGVKFLVLGLLPNALLAAVATALSVYVGATVMAYLMCRDLRRGWTGQKYFQKGDLWQILFV